ncbi:MAG: AAA family ATPase [Phycisphaerae bacterium]
MDNDAITPEETIDHGRNILEEFIGQRQAIDNVRVALEACWNDGTAFPHTLMVGPPGLGKTQLAHVIAAEMGSPRLEALSQTLESPSDLNALLLRAGDREVVFLDECDELAATPFQTLLYRAMEERKLFLGRQANDGKVGSIPLGNFSLLAATNNEFSLVPPLLSRFKLILRFDFYQPSDLKVIVANRAMQHRWSCEDEVFGRIAALARGVPRRAIHLLEAAHRTARSENADTITVDHFTKTCRLEGLDPLHGLDQTEQKYLRMLHEAQGAPVRVGTLVARLGLPPRSLSAVIESYLLRIGFVARRNDGRELTLLAVEYLQRLAAA